MNRFALSLICLLLLPQLLCAQKDLLRSGPMPGYSEMREVAVWLQTNKAAEVHLEYWTSDAPDQRLSTQKVQTVAGQAFTALLLADQVQPGYSYIYELFINGKTVAFDEPLRFHTQAHWQHRTEPPDFKFAFGSCSYINDPPYDRPGKPYGGNYEIYDAIANMNPQFMVWLGDNTYLRRPDWNTQTGIFHRYSQTRELPEMQKLLRSTHHYAIWDDHDFGPNDSDRSFIHKDKTLKAFKLFWGNPSYGLPGQGGITSAFSYADLDFFLLDNRSFRSPKDPKTGPETILGQTQLDWLIDALQASKAHFKMVAIGGQVLNTAAKFENYACFEEERTQLIDRICKEGITGVIFLTGDRHHTEMSQFTDGETGITIYDITASPLTSGAVKETKETNEHQVSGTLVNQRNFGVIDVSGTYEDRVLKVSILDVNGTEIWSRKIEKPK